MSRKTAIIYLMPTLSRRTATTRFSTGESSQMHMVLSCKQSDQVTPAITS